MGHGEVKDPVFQAIERDLEQALGVASPRRAEAMQMSVARDVGGWLLGQIPVIGPFLQDAFQDNVWSDMRRRLTSREVATFTEVTRRYPDSLALAVTFQRLPNEG